MWRHVLAFLLLSSALSACSAAAANLTVRVVTGLVEGPEFHSVRATVFRRSGMRAQVIDTREASARFGEDFSSGLNLASQSLSIGEYRVRDGVGAIWESSDATGTNGDQGNDLASGSGAVYVYTRTAGEWTQRGYIKPSNRGGNFGYSVALAGDTGGLAVGAAGEASNATGIGGNQADMSAGDTGAVYFLDW